MKFKKYGVFLEILAEFFQLSPIKKLMQGKRIINNLSKDCAKERFSESQFYAEYIYNAFALKTNVHTI